MTSALRDVTPHHQSVHTDTATPDWRVARAYARPSLRAIQHVLGPWLASVPITWARGKAPVSMASNGRSQACAETDGGSRRMSGYCRARQSAAASLPPCAWRWARRASWMRFSIRSASRGLLSQSSGRRDVIAAARRSPDTQSIHEF